MAKHRGHNEGTIAERRYARKDGTEVIRYVAQLPIDAHGKRPSLGSFATRGEARKALQDAAVKQAQGIVVGGKVPTVEEWYECWLASRTGIAYGTRESYALTLKTVAPYIGHIRLDKLTEMDIAAMWRKLGEGLTPDAHPRPRLSPTTQQTAHVHLNAALRAAVRSRHVPVSYNPAQDAKPEKGVRKEIHPFTEDEVQRLFAVTKNDREYPLWVTLITTGIRHGEAQGLRWQDIDFERGKLSVRRALHHEAGAGWVAGPTKTRKDRVVDLRPSTVAVLKAHQVRQMEMRRDAGSAWHEQGLVFTTAWGTPLGRGYIGEQLGRACKAAGIAPRTVKETRHTYATLALCNGVHPKVVQEALGHSSISITLDTYSHLVPTMQAAAMGHLDRLFP